MAKKLLSLLIIFLILSINAKGEEMNQSLNLQNVTAENTTMQGTTYTVGLAGSGAQYIASDGSAQDALNQAFSAASQTGGKVHLFPGTYSLTGDVEIGSNTILEGEGENTKIQVSSSSSQFFGLYGVIRQKTQPFSNIEIRNIWIDGNCQNLPTSFANYGNGDHNSERLLDLLGSKSAFSENVYIHDCHFSNSFSDGAHLAFIHNVRVENCTFENDQHSSIFFIDSTGEAAYNHVEAITDTGIRADNSPNLKIHDNYISSYQGDKNNGAFKDGCNGIQIADEGHSHGGGSAKPDATNNIEIWNNVIEHVGLAGIWMDTTGQSTNESVYIHHNTFKDCGYSSNAQWGAGISLHPWVNGAKIAYNTFDGCYQAAISVLSTIKTAVTVDIQNNNILNTKGNGQARSGGLPASQVGYGILNSAKAALNTVGNFFSGNLKGDSDSQISGSSSSMVQGAGGNGKSHISSVPITPIIPTVKKVNNSQRNNSQPEDILDFLNITVFDSGIINNPQLLTPEKHWQEKGKSKAWIDIVGWNNLTERDGVFYIPEGEQPIVRYDSACTASFGHTVNKLSVSQKNGNATADLEVKAVYKVPKKTSVSVLGKSIPSVSFDHRTQTSHYFDTEKMPQILQANINRTAYVTIHDNFLVHQTVVYVPENENVMKVSYQEGRYETWHNLHSGTANQTAKGVKYVEITDMDYWTDDNNVSDNGLIVPEALTTQELKNKVSIIQYDVYGNRIPIENYVVADNKLDTIIPPETIFYTFVLGVLWWGIYQFWKGVL